MANPKNRNLRQLGLFTATSLVIANIVGTGIFTTTGFLAADLNASVPILVAWVTGGIIALCGALTYAELAVNMPHNGGEYYYLSRLYHPAVGFLSGWVSLFAGFSAPIAATALAFGQYLQMILPWAPPLVSSIFLLLLFTFLHLLNVRLGGVVQNIITVVKVLLIAGLIAVAFLVPAERLHLTHSAEDWQVIISPAFAVGLIFIMFSYSGWNAAAYIGGEVKNPGWVLPRALIIGTGIVTVMYTLLNYFYLSAVPLEAIAGDVQVAHIVALAIIGPAGASFVTLVILLALMTSVSAMTMAGARVYQVLGEDHPFFSWLAQRTKSKSPANAILLQSSIALILLLTFTFDAILYYVGFTLSLFAGLTVFGVFILRRRGWSGAGYRTWGYPVAPVLFLLVTAWMVVYTFLDRTVESLIGLGTLGVGLVVYWWVRGRSL